MISTTHLIIFLIIIILVFGTKKLKNIGSDLGSAVKGFKDGMREGNDAGTSAEAPAQTAAPVLAEKPLAKDTVDVEAKSKS